MRHMKQAGLCDKQNGSLKNSDLPNNVIKTLLGIDSSSKLMW